MPDVSIIIPCHNEGMNIHDTVDSIRETTNDDVSYEIIVVNDGSTDMNYDNMANDFIKVVNIERRGISNAMNYGAKFSKSNILVFLDGHLKMQDNWLPEMIDTLEMTKTGILAPVIYDMKNPASKGYGCTTTLDFSMVWLGKLHDFPYEIPVEPGAVKMMKKSFFDKIGGFDSGFRQWAPLDIEISLRSWLFGYSIFIDPRIEIGHLFKGSFTYPVDPIIYESNKIRAALSHFCGERLEASMNLLKKNEMFQQSYLIALADGALKRREDMLTRRKFDDEWFFNKFGTVL